MQPQQTLDLKDIHLPEPVSWWPPAPGYWMILLLLCLSAVLFLYVRQRKQQFKVKKLALSEFYNIKNRYQQNNDDKQLITQLSALLRRTAISYFPRTAYASTSGDEWLTQLDKMSSSKQSFLTDAGRQLTSFHYSSQQHCEHTQQLLQLCEQWFNKLPRLKEDHAQ